MIESISPAARKRSLRRKQLVLSAVAVLTVVILLEVVLRVLGFPKQLAPHTETPRFAQIDQRIERRLLYLNQPGRITFRYASDPRGYFGPDNEVHHNVNPRGFRGAPFAEKAPGTRRIVFLGDSFTFGEGIHDTDTYPEIVARILKESGHQTESVNMGVGGYNTLQASKVLKIFGLNLEPDVVVLGYTLNDAEPPLFVLDPSTGLLIRRNREAIFLGEGEPSEPTASFLSRLHLVQAVRMAQEKRRISQRTVDHYVSIHAPGSHGRAESEQALREIISSCRERSIPCIVLMFPILYKLSDEYPFTAIHEEIGAVVRQEGGLFIDLLPPLRGDRAEQLWVHPTDHHPNEKVHALAGRLIADEIRWMRGFRPDLLTNISVTLEQTDLEH